MPHIIPAMTIPSGGPAPDVTTGSIFFINWLRVLGTAELAQIDQRVCQHLHPIMPLLEAFKAE